MPSIAVLLPSSGLLRISLSSSFFHPGTLIMLTAEKDIDRRSNTPRSLKHNRAATTATSRTLCD
ncbi:hypothetical protein NXC14_PA00531 (plasmid) [Rhizobium sp. NXC14]|nr:hypothetical protein NXC14_PA00531 [Rhizobium sp. NXC14]